MTKDKVAVVVLNWNGAKDTEKCVASLLKQGYKNFHIIIVDNGSSDNSIQILNKLAKANPDKISVLKNSRNLGFAGGVNVGIRYALENKYGSVALLNNDAVAEKSWLSSLVQELSKKPKVGIVTGLLLHSDGKTIDGSGEVYTIWGMHFPRSRNEAAANAPDSGYVFGGTGGGSLYRASLFKDIGLFDETFFLYYEDVDVNFRAQLAGWKVFYTKKAVAYHKRGASSKKVPKLVIFNTFKNIPLVFFKNVPTRLLFPIGIRFLLLYTLIFGNAVKNGGGWSALKGWLTSIWYFWTKTLWQRIKIQRNKKVSSEYIRSIILPDLPPEQTGVRKFRSFFTGQK